jgi:hypothetical protein
MLFKETCRCSSKGCGISRREATTQNNQEQTGKNKVASLVFVGHRFLLPVDKRKNMCESEKISN